MSNKENDNENITGKLNSIIEALQGHPVFSCTYDPRIDNESNFIWIGTSEGIGCLECHYEIIFHEDKKSFCKIPSVEVHFEGKNYASFRDIEGVDEKKLQYERWQRTRDRRIVVNGDSSKLLNPDTFVKEVINELKLLHRTIGEELRVRLQKIQKEDFLKCETFLNFFINNGAKLPEKRIIPDICISSKTILIEHTEIQKRLLKYLVNKYKSKRRRPHINYEVLLQNKRADIILEDRNSFQIFEIKTYQNPVACIREALGQLLEYQWRMNKIKSDKIKMIIVGPKLNSTEGKLFIKHIKKSYKMKIDYKGIDEF